MNDKPSSNSHETQQVDQRPGKRASVMIGLIVLLALLGLLIWKKGDDDRHLAQSKPSAEPSRSERSSVAENQASRRPPRTLRSSTPLSDAVPSAAGQRPNRDAEAIDILLVVADTVRADYTSLHGHKVETTPFLDAIAKEGIQFRNTFSVSTWTAPAMYTIMTGLYPREHGITDGVTLINGIARGQRVKGQPILPEQAQTLAEHLKEQGYDTFGINTNYHLGEKYGFAQGFDNYIGDDFWFMPFPHLALDALQARIEKSGKYFLWLHYFDPHFPFYTREPWFGNFNETQFNSMLEMSEDAVLSIYRKKNNLEPADAPLTEDVTNLHRYARALEIYPHYYSAGLPRMNYPTDGPYSKFFKAAYESEIRFTDENTKEAFAQLGVDDSTLIIMVSDHGEELLEHGSMGHRVNFSMYQEVLHVPLVIRLPKGARGGTVIDTPVSLVDILPTVMDLLGQEIPSDLSGRSLVPLIEGGEFPNRLLFAEATGPWGNSRAVIDYPWKYVRAFEKNIEQLFHLIDDPKEEKNLVTTNGDRAKKMRDELAGWMERSAPRWQTGEPEKPTGHALKRLMELGYIRHPAPDEPPLSPAGMLKKKAGKPSLNFLP